MKHPLKENMRAMEPYIYWYLLGVVAGSRDTLDDVARVISDVSTAEGRIEALQRIREEIRDKEAAAEAFKPRD